MTTTSPSEPTFTEKVCSRCKKEKSAEDFNRDSKSKTGLRAACRACMKQERLRLRDHYRNWRTSEERKAWYRNYRNATRDKLKEAARKAVRAALKRGDLVQKSCEHPGCERKNTEGHHEDYSKPLEVRWLCREHHDERHIELAKAGIRL